MGRCRQIGPWADKGVESTSLATTWGWGIPGYQAAVPGFKGLMCFCLLTSRVFSPLGLGEQSLMHLLQLSPKCWVYPL